ncbi:helix-turn-helix domain-containing protein [Nocardiopsis composta]|uniref:DNA-binding transcriptional ArsR family regulator n=1 Tax=Nocardiopsis composta TaxID=157465 RepID=A0A7W8QSC6_9ACTN|nr:helix-turn-helix domain-containing protein [Nocardiopsis composta]MBB5435003.1 DNA-binding transcriptional ArsR family regulator [Nocardiopsis composta]
MNDSDEPPRRSGRDDQDGRDGPPPGAPDEAVRGLRVLAHPLRLRLLSLLTGAAMSAAEAARELGESQANVSYHLRRLHAAGLLELAEEVQVRGGLARRYRHDPESGGFARNPLEDPAALEVVLGDEPRRRAARHDPALRRHFTDAEVWVDAEEWDRIIERAEELSTVLHRAARAPRTPGTIPVSATMLLFGMAAGSPPAPSGGGPEAGPGEEA